MPQPREIDELRWTLTSDLREGRPAEKTRGRVARSWPHRLSLGADQFPGFPVCAEIPHKPGNPGIRIGITIGYPVCLAKLVSQSACCRAENDDPVWHPVDVVSARMLVRQVALRLRLFTGVGLSQSCAAHDGTRDTAA